MRTTPPCSEQWARRSHASPRYIFPPLRCCVPAQGSKHNQSAHKPNQPPSLAEAHYSHGVATFGDTPAVAGCMEFPCQPCKETKQLCGVKVAAPRCCPQFTWQDKFHARIVPNPSLPECTSTEQVKKMRACKMAFKYGNSSACFVRWCWRAVPHNPIKVTRRTGRRQPIINKNNCANAKAAKIGFAPHSGATAA
ncbi:hypothetical protein TcCL_Unassigned01277 [Trypanosoma cruzi]|nr:hypothetical protein TcCL_Unassigned01277 [Trypanosoma cruzi]